MASASRTHTSTSRAMPQPGTPDPDPAAEGNDASRTTRKSSGQNTVPGRWPSPPSTLGKRREGGAREAGGLTTDTRDGHVVSGCFCSVLLKPCPHVEGIGGALSEGQGTFYHHRSWPAPGERELSQESQRPGQQSPPPHQPGAVSAPASPQWRQLPPSPQGPRPELYLNLMLERPRKSS